MSEVGYIVSSCALVSLLSFIAYYKTDGRAIRLALGVILISALIAPVGQMLSQIPALEYEYIADAKDGDMMREEELKSAFCEGVVLAVADKFSLDKGCIRVEAVGFDKDTFKCEVLRVWLSGTAVLADARRIESYLTDCGAKRGEVIINI